MTALKIILGIVMALLAIVIIFVVIMQEGRRAGINGAISGGADTFLSKTKARDFNSKLARLTKYLIVAFLVLAIILNAIAMILAK